MTSTTLPKEPASLRRLQNLTFRSFGSWSQDQAAEFAQVTLVYGHNGSGKSTLAAALSEAGSGVSGEVLDSTGHHHQLNSSLSIPIRVFNADYVRASIADFSAGTAAPIWAIGQEDVSLKSRIRIAEAEVSAAASPVEAADTRRKEAKRNLTSVQEQLRNDLRRLGDLRGVPGFGQDFTACQTQTAIGLIMSEGPATPTTPERADARIRQASKSLVYQAIGGSPAFRELLTALAQAPAAALPTPVSVEHVTGAGPEVTNWVQQGLGLHAAGGSCHFCGNGIDPARLEALRQLFSVAVEDAQLRLRRVSQSAAEAHKQVEQARGEVLALAPDQPGVEVRDEALQESADVLARLKEIRDSYLTYSRDPFLPTFAPLSCPSADGLDDVRDRQARAQTDVEATRAAAAADYVASLRFHYKDDITKLEQLHSAAEAELRQAQEELDVARQSLDSLLAQERRAAQDGSRHAAELTRDLHAYLGRDEFSVAFRSGDDGARPGYQLLRGQNPAENLSEGEKTALSLMYFLRSLDEEPAGGQTRTPLEEVVVWLDDPVTSMDGGAIIVAANFISTRLFAEACLRSAQVVVTTHDFRFLVALHETLPGKYRKPGEKLAMLQAFRFEPRISAMPDRHAMRHHVRLFKDVVEAALSSDAARQRLGVNAARRLLEFQGHWSFPASPLSEAARAMAQQAGFPDAQFAVTLKALHIASHAPDDDFDLIEEPTGREALEVLCETLRLLHDFDEHHFNAVSAAAGVSKEINHALWADLLKQAEHDIEALGPSVPSSIGPHPTSPATVIVRGWQQSALAQSPQSVSPEAGEALGAKGWLVELEQDEIHMRRATTSNGIGES